MAAVATDIQCRKNRKKAIVGGTRYRCELFAVRAMIALGKIHLIVNRPTTTIEANFAIALLHFGNARQFRDIIMSKHDKIHG